MPGSIDISGKSTATAEPDSYGFIRMDGANTVIGNIRFGTVSIAPLPTVHAAQEADVNCKL
jgi:hypothetical protein